MRSGFLLNFRMRCKNMCRHALCIIVCTCVVVCAMAGAAGAAESGPTETAAPDLRLGGGAGAGKSYLIPALEIPGFIIMLNGYDRLANSGGEYDSTPSTFWKHIVRGSWVVDQDPFSMNQLAHPYSGSIYYGFARSAGLSYWESLGYTFAGSLLWEMAGETTPPSVNDQIASGIAGTFFGEALFRMASLILEGGGDRPGIWRELSAAVLSPPTAFNRFSFGERFKPVFPSRNPAVFWRVRFGAVPIARMPSQDNSRVFHEGGVTGDLSMTYGLPGKPGYAYKRPFDYFQFEFAFHSVARKAFENVMVRGLLLGKEYDAGVALRGVWGLYGSYDYISPHVFRISSTALSLGTTAQWWLSRRIALQGSVQGGLGYGAAGAVASKGKRDYHYGAVPQGLLSLRIILGDTAAFEMAGREFYVSRLGGTAPRGSEIISRGSAGITFRIYGRHALGLQYTVSSRHAHYHDQPARRQTMETFGILYTLLGDTRMGAVEWRNDDL